MKTFLFTILSTLSLARAGVNVEVLFKPLPPDVQLQEGAIRSNVVAAVQDWAGRFQTRDCMIVVEFSIKPWLARGTGRSFVSAPYMGEMREG